MTFRHAISVFDAEIGQLSSRLTLPIAWGRRARRARMENAPHPHVEPFESTDEQYLMRTYGDLHVLLDTEFAGEAPGFVEDRWEHARHPVFYIHEVGEGAVLYLTLGHCRHHYDMQPLMDYWPTIDRCAWDLPVFYTLLRRGIQWAIEPINEETARAHQAAASAASVG